MTTATKEMAHSAPVESFLAPPASAPERKLRTKVSWSDLMDDDEKMDFSGPLVFDDDDDINKDSVDAAPTPINLSSKSSADSGFVSSTDASPFASFDQDKVTEVITPSLPIPIRVASRTHTPTKPIPIGKPGRNRYGTGFTEDELLFAMDRLGW